MTIISLLVLLLVITLTLSNAQIPCDDEYGQHCPEASGFEVGYVNIHTFIIIILSLIFLKSIVIVYVNMKYQINAKLIWNYMMHAKRI